jgi:hypothetical protein
MYYINLRHFHFVFFVSFNPILPFPISLSSTNTEILRLLIRKLPVVNLLVWYSKGPGFYPNQHHCSILKTGPPVSTMTTCKVHKMWRRVDLV